MNVRSRSFQGAYSLWLVGALMLGAGCQQSVMKQVEPAQIKPALNVPRTSITPAVSADPNDPAWAGAPLIHGFSLAIGSPPKDPVLPTNVRLLWDKDHLYIRFTCLGPKPDSPFGNTHDAKHYQGDAVEVFLDPVGDGKQYFEFQHSASGGILDQNTTLTADAESDSRGRLVQKVLQRNYWPNLSYDMPDVKVADSVTPQGTQFLWIADFSLPAAGVLKRTGKTNFNPAMSLRLNLMRYHWTGPIEMKDRKLIATNWSPVTWGCPHQSPAAMGRIELVNKPLANR
ncbi:hypothetical protein BH10PLA1_BH10PLA1_09340 [soil metagenome]